jgi:NAD(P)-dependent dehydrogenase (short-subunit alcohol dehydrogenase family)
MFDVNFSSAVLLCSNLLSQKKINSNASVVFVSSVSVNHPYTGGSLYISSKASLEAFNKAFALEVAAKKIRSNIVAPALVKTNIWNQIAEVFTPEEIEKIENQYPLGLGEPEDIANSIIFLLSDASKWITGTTFTMDGGLLLNSTK